jgi:hypothetical protein
MTEELPDVGIGSPIQRANAALGRAIAAYSDNHDATILLADAAALVAKANVVLSLERSESDPLLAWALAHGLHRDLDERGRLRLVSTTVGAERRSVACDRDPESPDFGRYHFARIAIATTETLERRWIAADPGAWSAAMGLGPHVHAGFPSMFQIGAALRCGRVAVPGDLVTSESDAVTCEGCLASQRRLDDEAAAGLPMRTFRGSLWGRKPEVDYAEIAARRFAGGATSAEVIESMRIDYHAAVSLDDVGRWTAIRP